MGKLNCWEYMKCGRERGGNKVSKMGLCPAASDIRLNGRNGGKNGGRACWTLTGTLCGGKIQGVYAQKLKKCLSCKFYKYIEREEGAIHQRSNGIFILVK